MALPNGEYFGRGTVLANPITIGGVTYNYAVKFDANTNVDDRAVCSGTVHAISGTTSKTIVCGRAIQTFSYTLVLGFGNTIVVEVPVLMGGNICPTNEVQRLYDSNNADRSFRGGDYSNRAQVGRAVKDSAGRLYPITSVASMAVAPSQVAWQGTDPITPIQRFTVNTTELQLDLPDISINARARIRHDPSEGGIWTAGGIADSTTLTRKIFGLEPTYYPPDASFTGAEYWIDLQGGQVVLGSGVEAEGQPVLVTYWHEDLDVVAITGSGFEFVNLEGTGATGYGDTEDDVCSLGKTVVYGSFNYLIYKRGGTFGAGAIEMRDGLTNESPLISVLWSDSGILSVRNRTSAGGSTSLLTLASSPSGLLDGDFFVIRLTRESSNPENVVVAVSPDGITYTDITNGNISTLIALKSVHLSVATWGTLKCQVTGLQTGDNFKQMAEGKASLFKVSSFSSIIWTFTSGQLSANAINEVINESSGATMTSSTSPARDHYKIVSGNIVTYAESGGDRIKVVYETDVDPPAIPGQAPRVIYTKNAAVQGSTTVGENKLHWHDEIVVDDPLGTLDLEVGESFTIVDGVIFPDDPVVQYSVKDDTDFESWATITGTDRYIMRANGVILIASTFMAALPSGENPCFRVTGTRILQNQSFFADVVNDLGTAVDDLENGWVDIGGGGGGDGFSTLSGGVIGPRLLPSGWTCATGNLLGVTGWEYSQNGEWMNFFESILPLAPLPYYEFDAALGGVYLADGWGEKTPNDPIELICGPNTYSDLSDNANGGLIVVGNGVLSESVGTFYGSLLPLNVGDIPADANFRFDPIGFTITDTLKNIASLDAEIIEAKMLVNITEIESYEWSAEQEAILPTIVGGSATDLSFYYKSTINGVVTREFRRNSSGTVTVNTSTGVPLPSTTAYVGFTSIGIKNKTGNVRLPRRAGTALEYQNFQDREYTSYGGSVSGGNVTSGKWSIIDATSVARSLIRFAQSGDNSVVLWPNSASLNIDTSDRGLSAYANSLRPAIAFTSNQVGDGHQTATNAQGSLVNFGTVSIGKIYARYRLPSGLVGDLMLPINRGPVIAGE
jgi:hypothetical protein